MKKYCIVSFCNIRLLPYANIYIDSVVQKGHKCDLLFWDRDCKNGIDDNYEGCNNIVYQYKQHYNNKLDLIKGYFYCSIFFCKILSDNNYDGVIFLQSHGSVACSPVILKKYPQKYIVDIRDYSLEDYFVFRYIENKILTNSYANVISSPAYKKFLPLNCTYFICHNYTPFKKESIEEIISKKDNTIHRINISFVGSVRFIEMDKKILKLFKNDDRFNINYYGKGSNELKCFAKENEITNSDFFDSFPQSQTLFFYRNTHLINNLYGNNDKMLDYALSNKLYHAALLKIPILVCPNTYMEELSLKYGIGFAFDINKKDIKEDLYDWFINIDRDMLNKGCLDFITHVKKENKLFFHMIDNFTK